MAKTTNTDVFRIGVVLYDNLLGTSATVPVEMLRTAEAAARALSSQAKQVEVVTLGIDDKPVRSPSAFDFVPTHVIGEEPECDLINLPTLWRNPRPALRKYRAVIPWLHNLIQRGRTVTAVGTGVCFMAETGLLDGLPATTHWHYFDQFQKDYPRVQLKRQFFTTQAGNLYCAASVNAMGELMVHLVNRLYGRQVASLVERNFFHEIRNAFEPQSFFSESVKQHPDEQITQAQIWLEDNFHTQVKVAELAEKFDFSQRNFDRRFRNALGKSPLQYLQDTRLRNAKELLKSSNLSIAEIANHCGYQNASSFTRIFRRAFHTSPRKYRETVRAKLFSP